jgi:hypothetical protein
MKLSHVAMLAFLLIVPLVTFAQGEPGWSKSSLGASFEVSVPVGDFSEVAGLGYGGNVRYQYGMDNRGVFTATAGYLAWTSKDLGANTSIKPSAFNIFLGGKYYFTGGLYGSLEGGLYFVSYTYEGSFVGASGNTTRFMLPIGLGFQKNGFEVGARYMLLDVNYNAFSFTVGYNFSL